VIGIPLWLEWLGMRPWQVPDRGRTPTRAAGLPLSVVCPHCTNTDTLSLHCRDDRCGWVRCTCGALIYSYRRHRHPRHGSDQDTCHDPRAAA
jgi:hypothetical protein